MITLRTATAPPVRLAAETETATATARLPTETATYLRRRGFVPESTKYARTRAPEIRARSNLLQRRHCIPFPDPHSSGQSKQRVTAAAAGVRGRWRDELCACARDCVQFYMQHILIQHLKSSCKTQNFGFATINCSDSMFPLEKNPPALSPPQSAASAVLADADSSGPGRGQRHQLCRGRGRPDRRFVRSVRAGLGRGKFRPWQCLMSAGAGPPSRFPLHAPACARVPPRPVGFPPRSARLCARTAATVATRGGHDATQSPPDRTRPNQRCGARRSFEREHQSSHRLYKHT